MISDKHLHTQIGKSGLLTGCVQKCHSLFVFLFQNDATAPVIGPDSTEQHELYQKEK